MRRIRFTATILAFMLLAMGMTAPAQDEREFSVELKLDGEKDPVQKIDDLNARIMVLQSAGELTSELGDLYNDLGVQHATLEEWPEAFSAFVHSVQIKPFDADFHRNLALTAIQLENYDVALAEFEEYRKRGGARALDAYRRLARLHLKMDDVGQAREAYQRGLDELGNEPSAEVCRLVLELARLENEQNDSMAMRQVLEAWQPVARRWREIAVEQTTDDGVSEAEAIETNLLGALLEDGQLLEESGLALDAADLYEKAYKLAPDRHEILPRLVGAYILAGDPFQAKVRARLARQEHPEQSGAWLASAKVYEADNQLDAALDAYKTAYDLEPETPGLRLKLGNLYMRQGQAAEGRKYLAEAIEAPGTPTEVVYNFAVSLMREKKFSAAIAPLRRVTRETPDFVGGWQALAQCYRAGSRFDKSIEAYEEALRLEPNAKLAYNLGVTAGRAKKWQRAVDAYDQALVLDPTYQEASYNRAVALMRASRLAEADSAFTAYLVLDPEHYRANLNHGVTLYKLGRYEDAVAAYNITLEIKETAEAWDNMGLAYQEIGNKKKAQACYKEAKSMRGKS